MKIASLLIFTQVIILSNAPSQTIPETKSWAGYWNLSTLFLTPLADIECEYIPMGNVNSWYLRLQTPIGAYEDWSARAIEVGYRQFLLPIAPVGTELGFGLNICAVSSNSGEIEFFLGLKGEVAHRLSLSKDIILSFRTDLYYFLGPENIKDNYPATNGFISRFPHKGIVLALTIGLGFSD